MVRVRLKQNANKVYSKNPVRDAIIRNIMRVVSFAFITFLIYALFFAATKLHILSLTGVKGLLLNQGVMVTLYALIFTVMLITTVFRLVQQLYLDDDNKTLLTLPVKQNSIFIAKILASFIINLQWSAMAFLPMFFAYGAITGMGAVYYLMTVLGTLLSVTFITVFAGLLSIPMLYVVMFIRKYQYIQVTIACLVLGAIIFLVFTAIRSIPTDFNILKNFSRYYWQLNSVLRWTGSHFPPFVFLTQMFIGTNDVIPGLISRIVHRDVTLNTLWTALTLIAVIIAMLAAVWYISRPLFLSMASRQFENNRRTKMKKRSNHKLSPFLSQIKIEAVDIYRNPRRFFSNTIYLFIMPFAVMLFNKVFLSMRISSFGDKLCMGGNIFLMAMLMLVSNTYAASVFSNEGVTLPLMRTRPFSVVKFALAKVLIKTVFGLAALGTSISFIYELWQGTGRYSDTNLTLVFFIIAVFYLAHLFWSMDLGLLNPQNAKYHDGVHDTGDPNEAVSFIIAFITSLLVFGVFVFLVMENALTAYIKVLCIGVGFMLLRLVLSYIRVNVMLTTKGEVLQ